jgi:hypothetical protein
MANHKSIDDAFRGARAVRRRAGHAGVNRAASKIEATDSKITVGAPDRVLTPEEQERAGRPGPLPGGAGDTSGYGGTVTFDEIMRAKAGEVRRYGR